MPIEEMSHGPMLSQSEAAHPQLRGSEPQGFATQLPEGTWSGSVFKQISPAPQSLPVVHCGEMGVGPPSHAPACASPAGAHPLGRPEHPLDHVTF